VPPGSNIEPPLPYMHASKCVYCAPRRVSLQRSPDLLAGFGGNGEWKRLGRERDWNEILGVFCVTSFREVEDPEHSYHSQFCIGLNTISRYVSVYCYIFGPLIIIIMPVIIDFYSAVRL